MLLTNKSVSKNLQKVINQSETVIAYAAMKSKAYGRGILALTSENRFIITNAPVFRKLKVKDTFTAIDVSFIDFVSEIKMGGAQIYIFMNIKGNDAVLKVFYHPINNDVAVMKFINTIYEQNPSAIPNYLKEEKLIDFLTTKEGTFKITSNKIIVQDYIDDKLEDIKTINTSDITDFDVYPQKMGSKGILYLEVNNEPQTVKFEKTTEENDVFALMAGGTSVMFPLSRMVKIFNKTNANNKTPNYMSDDEIELVTELATKKALGIDVLGNKIFRLTNKNIFFLKIGKAGKLEPFETVPLETINTYREITRGKGDRMNSGLEVVTKSDKKHEYWSVESIDIIIEELNKLLR